MPLAIYLAGATPVFLDISRVNFGLSLDDLRSASGIDAVIAVHAYGTPCKIVELESYCAERGIIVIEDIAVAQGATINDRPAGAFGSVSVVSFGAGKTIDAGGGGAILTDDVGVYNEIVNLDSKLPSYENRFGKNVSDLGKYHTQLYNDIYLAGEYNKLPDLFKQRALEVGPSLGSLGRTFFPASICT